ncbi:DUF5994 family protein [Nocardia sp. NPDC023852]|uniref:DUF5994 family protein n=1 Tax=Nocardia sp. NPDC023852 TaxID=3154697 RepID=UPI0033E45C33
MLPDLLAVLIVRLRPIWRVAYDLAGWSSALRQLTVGDRAIRLDTYPLQLWNTMYVFGSGSGLIVLRAIPSATGDEPTHSALMAAVDRGQPPPPGDSGRRSQTLIEPFADNLGRLCRIRAYQAEMV